MQGSTLLLLCAFICIAFFVALVASLQSLYPSSFTFVVVLYFKEIHCMQSSEAELITSVVTIPHTVLSLLHMASLYVQKRLCHIGSHRFSVACTDGLA